MASAGKSRIGNLSPVPAANADASSGLRWVKGVWLSSADAENGAELMSRIAEVVGSVLRGGTVPLWQAAWGEVYHRSVARRAAECLDLRRGAVLGEWNQLDDPIRRAQAIPVTSAAIDACTDLLLPQKSAINDALVNAGFKPIHGKALRSNISTEIATLLGTVGANTVFQSNPFPHVWPHVADLIVGQISSADPEWLVLNKLLLGGYFVSCRLPLARYVSQHLLERPRAILSIRGTLVRIVERVSKSGVQDAVPPISNRQADLKLQHANVTALLKATEAELHQTLNGNGMLHRFVPSDYRPEIPPDARHIVKEADVLRGRDMALRQHEYTILAYMALGCIEQLLRAWAARCGLDHRKKNGQPRSVLDWIGLLPCSLSLRMQIERLYDSRLVNIRNRIMHGGLHEIENKQFEMAIAFIEPRLRAADSEVRDDPYTPENIAQLCFECLELIDRELAAAGGVSTEHFTWASGLNLFDSEVEVGLRVPWDLTGPEGEFWLNMIQVYLTAVMPAFTQFFRAGYIGWGRPYSTDALPSVMGLMSIFETLYRLTVHLMGMSVLQMDPTRTHFQYRMLDSRTLCTSAILDRLLSHIPVSERAIAKEVMLLAVKARNSFAHGAVLDFDKRISKGTGHLVMKSIQTLVTAGVHHMKQEAAYYNWRNLCGGQAGHDLANWLAGERQINYLLVEAAKDVHPASVLL